MTKTKRLARRLRRSLRIGPDQENERATTHRVIFMKLRIPLGVQIGAVVVLFFAALGTLWRASTSVVGREERRAWAIDRLEEASDLLDSLGQEALAAIRRFPDYMGPDEWAVIDRQLSEKVAQVRTRFPGVECGYYDPNRSEQSFPDQPLGDGKDRMVASASQNQSVVDAIETQANAAFRKKSAILVVEDIPPGTIAIRASPVYSSGRVIASTWTMIRLDDPIFPDRSSAGYRLFAGLALTAIALSLALTFNLFRTVRRQTEERNRLQVHLRRSERLAALGKLLAGVAHEVRNPLAGIRSTAQLWQRGIGIDDESLKGLVDEVDRMEEIVSRLLQFSRAEAQDLAPGDLNAVLAEAARLATPLIEQKQIRLIVDLDSALPTVAMAPPALLQVFRNLTTNAIQAMPVGGTLRLTTSNETSKNAVQATVADTGPGMTAETLDHLFEPFFTTRAEGTGLGLAIAREIALAHQGDLHAANRQDGPGAVFTLTLPAASSELNGETRP